VLAERLLEHVPYLDKVFFANSGARNCRSRDQFAVAPPAARHRSCLILSGLSYGALSLMERPEFRSGSSRCCGMHQIAFNDLAALEQALSSRQVAASCRAIQARASTCPRRVLPGAAALCRKYATLFIADEIQTGIAVTGKSRGRHWNVEPDMCCWRSAVGWTCAVARC